MNEFFNTNNPGMRLLSNIFNVFWLNLMFLFTCLPIITIGPSLCAMYRVCIKIVSGEDPSVHKEYFGEFKKSFKKATIMWIGVLVLLGFFSFELYGIYFRHDLVPESLSFLQYPVWLMIFLVLPVFLYGFALLATFENTLKNTIKNSILLGIKNIVITIMLIAIWLFSPLVINTFPDFTFGMLGFELFFNMALRGLICSLFLHKAFGLRKLKVGRDGKVREISYEDGEASVKVIDDDEVSSEDEETESDTDEDSSEE